MAYTFGYKQPTYRTLGSTNPGMTTQQIVPVTSLINQLSSPTPVQQPPTSTITPPPPIPPPPTVQPPPTISPLPPPPPLPQLPQQTNTFLPQLQALMSMFANLNPFGALPPEVAAALGQQTAAEKSQADLTFRDAFDRSIADLYGRGVERSTIATDATGRLASEQSNVMAQILAAAAQRELAAKQYQFGSQLQSLGAQGQLAGTGATLEQQQYNSLVNALLGQGSLANQQYATQTGALFNRDQLANQQYQYGNNLANQQYQYGTGLQNQQYEFGQNLQNQQNQFNQTFGLQQQQQLMTLLDALLSGRYNSTLGMTPGGTTSGTSGTGGLNLSSLLGGSSGGTQSVGGGTATWLNQGAGEPYGTPQNTNTFDQDMLMKLIMQLFQQMGLNI